MRQRRSECVPIEYLGNASLGVPDLDQARAGDAVVKPATGAAPSRHGPLGEPEREAAVDRQVKVVFAFDL